MSVNLYIQKNILMSCPMSFTVCLMTPPSYRGVEGAGWVSRMNPPLVAARQPVTNAHFAQCVVFTKRHCKQFSILCIPKNN
jgi:hypothetical protein